MTSIIDLSQHLNILPKQLNHLLIQNGFYVSTTFGISDGFIDEELSSFLLERYCHYRSLLLSEEEILINKTQCVPIEKDNRVYFLIQDDTIVYVGQSIQLLGRLQNHVDNKEKKFNYVYYTPVPRKEMLLIEMFYINKLTPIYNTTNNNSLDIITQLLKQY